MKMEELPNYKYDKEYDSFCYQNCIKLVLASYGIKKPNLFINMTLSFKLKFEENQIYIFDDDARNVLPQYKDMVERFYYESDIDDSKHVWEINRSLIHKGESIIVGVDSYHLEYLPYYKKSHGKHTLIIDGFDEDRQMVSVVDWFSPWFFIGEVPLKQFLEARESLNEYDGGIYSGRPIYNNWAKVNKNGWMEDYAKLVHEQLSLSYNQYFENDCKGDEYNGIYATQELKNILKHIKVDFDYDQKIEFLKKLHNQLYRSNRRRDFFKLFIRESFEETKIEEFKSLELETVKFYEMWEKFIYKIIKCYLRYSEDSFSKLIEDLEKIIGFESQYKEMMKNILQTSK